MIALYILAALAALIAFAFAAGILRLRVSFAKPTKPAKTGVSFKVATARHCSWCGVGIIDSDGETEPSEHDPSCPLYRRPS